MSAPTGVRPVRRWRGGGPLRRLRATAAPTVLLALLALTAGALVTATPRLSNGYADRSLRADVAPLPHQARDVTISLRRQPGQDSVDGPASLDRFRRALPPPLPALVGRQWYAADVAPADVTATGDVGPFAQNAFVQLGLRAQTGADDAVRMTAGTWPRSTVGAPAQVAVSGPVAEALALRPGVTLRIQVTGGGAADVVVSGVFAPVDAGDPLWAAMPHVLEPLVPVLDGEPYVAGVLTDWAGLAGTGLATTGSWRYRIDEQRLDTSSVDAVTAAVGAARRAPWLPGASVESSLDTTLVGFAARLTSVRALLAVVQAGLLASLVGLLLLAARIAVRSRRTEVTLLRSRGASLGTVGARALTEAALVHPAAVGAGALLGALVPGRPDGTWWLVPLLAVGTTVAVPVFVTVGQRPVGGTTGRADVAWRRPSARRLTVEVSVVLSAVAGVLLLRRRGLAADADVDGFLAAVPVLLAVAVAVVALRVLPAPLRLLDRIAARSRGALVLLGVARAGRAAPVTTGALAVLVVAVSTAVFAAVVADTVDRARDRAADLVVPGDAWITGYAFDPATADRLARVPGVRAVARARLDTNRPVLSDATATGRNLGTARVLVVDAPAFARVAADSGVDADVPRALRAARRGDGPVPALVSAPVAASVDRSGAVDLQGRPYGFTVAGVVEEFPGVAPGTDRFVVLPWQALTEYAYTPIIPNRFLVAVDGRDPAALLRAADDGQRRWQSTVLGDDVARPEVPAQLATRAAYRQGLDRTGANEVLSVAFTVGAVGGGVLAVLAVGFAVLADAHGRGRMLSRLRTLGLSAGQGRRLLVYELVPVVTAAVVAGAAVGTALPWLIGPALGLSAFTPGVDVGWRPDPLVVGAVPALVAVGLAAGLVVEIVVNRRTRLGAALRLGEENP